MVDRQEVVMSIMRSQCSNWTRQKITKGIRVDGPIRGALEYEIVQVVDTGPILRDMAFSVDHKHLYLMSDKQNLWLGKREPPSLSDRILPLALPHQVAQESIPIHNP
ncbi:Hypothetical predicted protein [Podarcis lilfordi]|uniref:Uncharacterized protein n=1 Tax=Podarcis lilfordi TaxID=74358 RepID=A0AA35PJ18_9SAUR|nr:Hypothetical predicted protein [Podarcis lilfordi]